MCGSGDGVSGEMLERWWLTTLIFLLARRGCERWWRVPLPVGEVFTSVSGREGFWRAGDGRGAGRGMAREGKRQARIVTGLLSLIHI